jgi:outer membrane immunogenic protein
MRGQEQELARSSIRDPRNTNRGRLGYLYKPDFLTFVSAGVSFADLGLSYTNEVANNYSTNQFQPGWLVGGGVEWAAARFWSVRLEYYYNQYNYLNMPMDYIYGVYDGSGHGKLNLSSNNIRLGVNYWFL